jgi:GTP pyrophosphokinase
VQLSERFEEALVYATRLHANQVRKVSGSPYIEHLLGVASIALAHGADEDEAIGALLHDAVEDQGGAPTLEVIRSRFSDRVAAIVDGCSDTDAIPKPPWEQRKRAYIGSIADASRSVLLVSASDKLYNCRSLEEDCRRDGEQLWESFAGRRDGTLWYFRSLVDAYRAREPTGRLTELIDELDRTVTRLAEIAGV